MWYAIGNRGPTAGCKSGGGGEARPDVAEQRPPPLALRHPGPTSPRRKKVLRQILRRLDRSHQHQATPVHTSQGRPDTWRRVPRERQL